MKSICLILIILMVSSGSYTNSKLHSENEPIKLIDLPRLGKIKPRNSQEIENNPWGIQAGSMDEEILAKAAAIGVKWTRLSARWPEIEKEKGIYDWSETDKAFNAALKFGITPFITLVRPNALYSEVIPHQDRAKAEIYGERPAPPTYSTEAMQAWLKFVEATVNRYKDRIKYWEIWNEPNHHAYWGKGPDPKDYGKLAKATAALIKELDHESKVIAGSTAGIVPEWTDEYLDKDLAEDIDIISYHQYGGEPEERFPKTLELIKVINKYNPAIEIWQGETGYPSHSSTIDARGRAPWGLNIQAKWLLRQALSDVALSGAQVSNYFVLHHGGDRNDLQERSFLTEVDSTLGYYTAFGRARGVGVNEKCLLHNPSGEPKPGYYAYQNLCAVFDNRYQKAEIIMKTEVTDPGIFYGIGSFEDAFPSVPLTSAFKTAEDNYFIAYWLPWHGQEFLSKLASITLSANAQFEDPVLVDLLTGEVYQLSKPDGKNNVHTFTNLPLADYPMVIVEKTEIEIN